MRAATSEVDSLHELKAALLGERDKKEAETSKLLEEYQKTREELEQIKVSSAKKIELLQKTWEKEKHILQVICYFVIFVHFK